MASTLFSRINSILAENTRSALNATSHSKGTLAAILKEIAVKQKFSNIEIIENLKQHLLPCFHDLNEFDTLFPDNELQMEIYNEIAPNFFIQLNKMYFDKFILSISRLLDPAKQSNNENLSIFQLLKIAEESNYSEIERLKIKIDEIKIEAQDIRKLRSKFLAHRDVSHSELIVGTIEFEMIKELFSKMANCINEIESHLGLPKTFFYWLRDQYGAIALLRNLKDSLIYRDIRTDYDKWQEDEARAKTSKFYNY